MTSIYRQPGHGVDRLFRAVVRDSLGLSEDQISWSYQRTKRDASVEDKKLDARIDLDHLKDRSIERQRVQDWLSRCANFLGYNEERTRQIRGAIFEVRQGYKSADSKRQAADMEFAMNAVAENYLPVLSVISTQVSEAVISNYRNKKMLVVIGNNSIDDTKSTYAFFRNAVGFELDQFFERNSEHMRVRCRAVLEKLLSPA